MMSDLIWAGRFIHPEKQLSHKEVTEEGIVMLVKPVHT